MARVRGRPGPLPACLALVALSTLLAKEPASGGGDAWTSNLSLDSALLPLAADPRDSLAVYAGASSNLYKTLDGGTTWGIVGSLPAGSPVFSLAIDPTGQRVYAGSQGVADVFRSVDGGSTWEALSFGGSLGAYPRSLAVDPSNAGIVYAGLARDGLPGGSLLKSTDSGATWTATIAGLPTAGGGPAVLAIVIDPQTPSVLYAGLDRSGVYKSVNGGIRWEAAGLPSHTVNGLAVDPTATSTLYAATAAGMFKTTDGASSWRESSSGLRDPGGSVLAMQAVAIDPIHPQTLYAGAAQMGGVYRSLDGGATWGPWNEGLTDPRVLSLAIDSTGTQLHAGTRAGVFDRSVPAERLVIRSPRRRPSPRLLELPRP
ncbi:MAG: hypothetical protein ACRD3M_01225 [Thermoanaerobaculia bacterium]